MSGVSNFLVRADASPPLEIRPVQRAEIDQALRLILAAENRHETDLAVVEFLQLAVWRGLDLTGIWVAADPNERIQWAVLPISQPGRTISLLVPPRLRPGLIDTHVAELCASACIEPRHNGVNLAQVMMDTQAKAVVRSLVHAGFEDVAELMYLAREVRSRIPGRIFRDTTLRIWKYDRAVHARFSAVIERSYEDSLDCPKLTGKRHIEDVVSGHKASGEFDPNLWHLVSDVHNNDLGVILLNRMHRRAGLELVYVGIVPEARGKGIGDGLVRLGINALAEEGGGHIITACDAANAPARRLYHRHGFGYLHSKRALVKTLTPATPQTKALITTTAMILRRQGVPAPMPR